MLINQISNKNTLKAVKKHNINLNEVDSFDELSILIRRRSRNLWYHLNKDYFKNKYKNEYRDHLLKESKTKIFFKELPNVM